MTLHVNWWPNCFSWYLATTTTHDDLFHFDIFLEIFLPLFLIFRISHARFLSFIKTFCQHAFQPTNSIIFCANWNEQEFSSIKINFLISAFNCFSRRASERSKRFSNFPDFISLAEKKSVWFHLKICSFSKISHLTKNNWDKTL